MSGLDSDHEEKVKVEDAVCDDNLSKNRSLDSTIDMGQRVATIAKALVDEKVSYSEVTKRGLAVPETVTVIQTEEGKASDGSIEKGKKSAVLETEETIADQVVEAVLVQTEEVSADKAQDAVLIQPEDVSADKVTDAVLLQPEEGGADKELICEKTKVGDVIKLPVEASEMELISGKATAQVKDEKVEKMTQASVNTVIVEDAEKVAGGSSKQTTAENARSGETENSSLDDVVSEAIAALKEDLLRRKITDETEMKKKDTTETPASVEDQNGKEVAKQTEQSQKDKLFEQEKCEKTDLTLECLTSPILVATPNEGENKSAQKYVGDENSERASNLSLNMDELFPVIQVEDTSSESDAESVIEVAVEKRTTTATYEKNSSPTPPATCEETETALVAQQTVNTEGMKENTATISSVCPGEPEVLTGGTSGANETVSEEMATAGDSHAEESAASGADLQYIEVAMAEKLTADSAINLCSLIEAFSTAVKVTKNDVPKVVDPVECVPPAQCSSPAPVSLKREEEEVQKIITLDPAPCNLEIIAPPISLWSELFEDKQATSQPELKTAEKRSKFGDSVPQGASSAIGPSEDKETNKILAPLMPTVSNTPFVLYSPVTVTECAFVPSTRPWAVSMDIETNPSSITRAEISTDRRNTSNKVVHETFQPDLNSMIASLFREDSTEEQAPPALPSAGVSNAEKATAPPRKSTRFQKKAKKQKKSKEHLGPRFHHEEPTSTGTEMQHGPRPSSAASSSHRPEWRGRQSQDDSSGAQVSI